MFQVCRGRPEGVENVTLLLRRTGLPTHEMTLSTRTHDASFGPLYYQSPTNLYPQLLPRLRAGHTADNHSFFVSQCGTRSVVAWPRNVLPPPPPHHHRHPLHSSINSLPRAAPDATPGLRHVGSGNVHV